MWSRFKNRVFADRQRVRELGSFTAGMVAARQGRPISDCPYGLRGRANRKRKAWIKGWREKKMPKVREKNVSVRGGNDEYIG